MGVCGNIDIDVVNFGCARPLNIDFTGKHLLTFKIACVTIAVQSPLMEMEFCIHNASHNLIYSQESS